MKAIEEIQRNRENNITNYSVKDEAEYCGPHSSFLKDKKYEILKYFDLFSHNPSFSFRGKWTVKTVFSSLLSIGLIILVVIMYYKLTGIYDNGVQKNYGYERSVKMYYPNTI